MEMLLLLVVGFLPTACNLLANAMVSFACAMQVQTFRKVNGYGFASTMCIGNLRSGTEALCVWMRTKNAKAKDKAFHYFAIILLFGLGAGFGSVGIQWFGRYAVWCSCLLLVVSFILMFIKEDIEENPALSSELHALQQDVHKVDVLLKEELHEEHEELRESLHHDN